MRSFSSKEKIYLKHIVNAYISSDWKKMRLRNLIQSIFDRKIDFESLFFNIELKKGESNSKADKIKYAKAIKEGYIPLSNFNSLLFYLQSNNLIFIVPYFEISELKPDLNGDNDEVITEESAGNTLSLQNDLYLQFIKSHLSDFICPTKELIDFVNDGFVTKEDQKFRLTTLISISGIVVAIIISIVGYFDNNTPTISNTFNPKVIIQTKEDLKSVPKKIIAVDSVIKNK